jgi:uncharacterized membrane protein
MNGRDTWILAIVVCLFACAYAIGALFRHWHFDSAFDLAIFDQAVWHLSRFEAPASTISGFSNILADHFYPIVALFAPLYWILPGPEALVSAQAMLLAASIVPVFLYLQDRLPRRAAFAMAVAYGLFWGLQRAATSDVHEFAFAPLCIATAILAIHRRQWGLMWIAALATALIKEDLVPLLGCLGLYLFVQGERRRGVVLMGSAVIVFVLLVGFLIPRIGDSTGYRYTGSYQAVLERPWMVPAMLVTPAVKIQTMLSWLAPFAWLPLLSPLSMLLVPLVLERFLSASVNHWGALYHYSAPLAPILAMSAGDGLARVARRIPDARRRTLTVAILAGACVVLSAVVPGHQPLWRLFTSQHYQLTAVHRAGYRALQQIPPEASVVAQTAVAPHVSQRARVYLLTPEAPDADFVIAARVLSVWPLESVAQLTTLLDQRRQRGYQVVFDELGWIVLRRPISPSS